MNLSEANPADTPQGQSRLHHNWAYRRVALPIFALLRMGASPQKLAWSIAAGLLIGINPILGSTTVFCLAAAFLLRLNVAASQLANHVVYPLQLLLIIPFIHLGDVIFHTGPIPFSARTLIHAARANPSPSPASSGDGSGMPSCSGSASPPSPSPPSPWPSRPSSAACSPASSTTNTPSSTPPHLSLERSEP